MMITDPVKSGATPAPKSKADELVELGTMTEETKGGAGNTAYDGAAGFYF
jgi:hypothetical protein